ncbi:MAG TPA: septal ring lytic transglycosylase RlpA family protein [Solirubrobacteraceae bacterium]
MTLTVLPATAESTDTQGTQTTPVATEAVVKPATRVRTKLGVTSARRHILAGRRTSVRGKLYRGGSGRVVKLQLRRGKRWVTVARTKTRRNGRYTVRATVRRIGTYRLRVRFAGDKTARGSRRTIGRLNVYRKVFASWYSIGGGTVACPGGTRGAKYTVAHKSLPCGTKVTFRYRGRTVRATVVDRGPFVGNREYDLEAATKQALRAGDLTTLMSTR